ncbi:hypothetical protein C0991_004782, partial [Blastosporella zonata]
HTHRRATGLRERQTHRRHRGLGDNRGVRSLQRRGGREAACGGWDQGRGYAVVEGL